MASDEIPIIDLEPFLTGMRADQVWLARGWSKIFETLGFVTIIGHGIPLPLMDAVQAEAKAFFALPIEQRMLCTYPGEQRAQGYMPVGDETVARSKGADDRPISDLCESLTFPYLIGKKARLGTS